MHPLLKEIAELWKEYEKDTNKMRIEDGVSYYTDKATIESFLHFLTTKL